jgi:hypothetical protein
MNRATKVTSFSKKNESSKNQKGFLDIEKNAIDRIVLSIDFLMLLTISRFSFICNIKL